jgi:hypothetical protein
VDIAFLSYALIRIIYVEVLEITLVIVMKIQTEVVYSRGDLLEKHSRLMEE